MIAEEESLKDECCGNMTSLEVMLSHLGWPDNLGAKSVKSWMSEERTIKKVYEAKANGKRLQERPLLTFGQISKILESYVC